jgi:carbonic anhydrase
VAKGYPTFLLSTPIITTDIPDEVAESQSPINIQTGQTVKFLCSTTIIQYGSITLSQVLNNGGENLRINLSDQDKANNYVIIAGKKYTLNQFHFHYSSEHTINGQYSRMEIHFVNIDTDNSHAVLGVLVEFGDNNHNLQTLFDASPTVPGGINVLDSKINIGELFPKNTFKYYTYSGSLTTPNFGPNSDGANGGPVTWIVFKDQQHLSSGQLDQYKEIYIEPNVRLVRPLNGRSVYESIGNIGNDKW